MEVWYKAAHSVQFLSPPPGLPTPAGVTVLKQGNRWVATQKPHAKARRLNLTKHDLKDLWAQAHRNRTKVKTWAKVAGPVSAVRKTAKRIGWKTLGSFRWQNVLGAAFYLDKGFA